jgi:hypothetical protein
MLADLKSRDAKADASELGDASLLPPVLAVVALGHRLVLPLPRWASSLPPCVIGAVAMFWVLQRVAAF